MHIAQGSSKLGHRALLFAQKEPMLLFFLLLLLFLALLFPEYITYYSEFVDWRTIIALSGLLIVTVSIEESGELTAMARALLYKMKNERNLALVLVGLSALLSTFLTNDIALFIIVPITVKMLKIIKNDIYKIIIFEALAVNAGSLLTPIGNPQNLFLWNISSLNFLGFIITMLPLFLLLMSILFIFTFLFFPSREMTLIRENSTPKASRALFYISLSLLTFYILALNFLSTVYILILLLIYLFIFYKFLAKVDWFFVLLFILVFIDFGVISGIPAILAFFSSVGGSNGGTVFIISVLLSQFMSNVPATVFVTKFTPQFKAVAYGVNLGGNGMIIASMANVIAMRMVRIKGLIVEFHKYSLLFLTVSFTLAYLLFFY